MRSFVSRRTNRRGQDEDANWTWRLNIPWRSINAHPNYRVDLQGDDFLENEGSLPLRTGSRPPGTGSRRLGEGTASMTVVRNNETNRTRLRPNSRTEPQFLESRFYATIHTETNDNNKCQTLAHLYPALNPEPENPQMGNNQFSPNSTPTPPSHSPIPPPFSSPPPHSPSDWRTPPLSSQQSHNTLTT